MSSQDHELAKALRQVADRIDAGEVLSIAVVVSAQDGHTAKVWHDGSDRSALAMAKATVQLGGLMVDGWSLEG